MLFNEYLAYTQEGSDLYHEIETRLQPAIEQALAHGFTPEEIATVVVECTVHMLSTYRLQHGINLRRQERPPRTRYEEDLHGK